MKFLEFHMNFIEFPMNFLNSEGCITQIIQPAIHPASLKESKEIRKFMKFTGFKEIHRKFNEIQGNSKEIHKFYKKSLNFL